MRRASVQDDADVRSTYEDLRAEHGFRITDYKVDSDAASPRVCFQFSEPLATGKVDFTPYVAVSGAANAAVTAEGPQLCVDGLKHGERYAIVLRQGLPSSVGESLLKSADYEIYVRDRSPQVRFTGRNYVLPRTGQEGIPVVSVNTPRSMSRSTASATAACCRPCAPTTSSASSRRYSAGEIADEKGVKIWNGTLDTAIRAQPGRGHGLPGAARRSGKLEPGVYVMTAQAA